MEGVAAEAAPPAEDGGQHQACAAVSWTQTSARQRCEAPELADSAHLEDGDQVSDATESADSEVEGEAPWGTWEVRRSSSSSGHSGEDADTLETKQFMKAYVEKVFHGK